MLRERNFLTIQDDRNATFLPFCLIREILIREIFFIQIFPASNGGLSLASSVHSLWTVPEPPVTLCLVEELRLPQLQNVDCVVCMSIHWMILLYAVLNRVTV